MRHRGVNEIGTASPSGSDLAEFVSVEGQSLVRFAYLLTGDQTAADDLVQSVLLQLSRRGIADVENPRAYARRAVVNLHNSLGRRSGAYLRALGRSGRVPTHVPSETGSVDDRDMLWRALQTLNPRQRVAVVLRYYEDCSDERIAEVLGCATGTVRSLISRSLPKLRDVLLPVEGTAMKETSDD